MWSEVLTLREKCCGSVAQSALGSTFGKKEMRLVVFCALFFVASGSTIGNSSEFRIVPLSSSPVLTMFSSNWTPQPRKSGEKLAPETFEKRVKTHSTTVQTPFHTDDSVVAVLPCGGCVVAIVCAWRWSGVPHGAIELEATAPNQLFLQLQHLHPGCCHHRQVWLGGLWLFGERSGKCLFIF